MAAAAASKTDLNYDIRRNVYESNGKEATPADTKEGAANGESSTANGTAEDATSKLENSLKDPAKRYFCYSCGAGCTGIRYHNSKTPGTDANKYDICSNCLLKREFPSNTKKEDYVKIESNPFPVISDKDSPWTETEELLLLEGLEMYDDDWNKISDWVGNRTREECVLKFLQLEIEDKYMEPEPGLDAAGPGVGMLNYLGAGRVPFNQADNPVLSTMAYLVGLADPKATAAASGRAVEEVRKTMRARLEKSGATDKGKEKEGEPAAPSASDVKAEESMDVDATDSNTVATREKDASNPMVTVPFALSASRAAALASHEERSITRLIHTATNLQMEKLELKHKQFSELEALLSAERRDLERRRQALFLDRLAFQKRMSHVQELFERATLLPPAEGAKLVRQAVQLGRRGEEGEGLAVKRVGAEDGGAVGPVEGKSFEI